MLQTLLQKIKRLQKTFKILNKKGLENNLDFLQSEIDIFQTDLEKIMETLDTEVESIEHFKGLNHCQQVDAISVLIKGFFVARFEDVANLDNKVAKMTFENFYEQVLKPRLECLKFTGEKMEEGLTGRQEEMKKYKNFIEHEGKIIGGDRTIEEEYQMAKKRKKLMN